MKLLQPLKTFQELISPTCSRTAFLLSRQLDDPLPAVTALFMRTHLLLCRQCRAYSHNLTFLNAACSSYATHIPNLSAQHLSDPARRRLQAQLKSLLNGETQKDH